VSENEELSSEFEIDREALVEAFVVESAEVLAAMEQQLLALEARPDDEETLHSLFRAAHTLKGSSSLVAFDAVRDLSHHLEGLLERLRAKTLRAEAGLVTTLLRGVDLLRSTIAASAAGNPADAPALEAHHEESSRGSG
jgi:two-component system chemotaxis sensor kinase CheA